jgi:hypothetical protein
MKHSNWPHDVFSSLSKFKQGAFYFVSERTKWFIAFCLQKISTGRNFDLLRINYNCSIPYPNEVKKSEMLDSWRGFALIRLVHYVLRVWAVVARNIFRLADLKGTELWSRLWSLHGFRNFLETVNADEVLQNRPRHFLCQFTAWILSYLTYLIVANLVKNPMLHGTLSFFFTISSRARS